MLEHPEHITVYNIKFPPPPLQRYLELLRQQILQIAMMKILFVNIREIAINRSNAPKKQVGVAAQSILEPTPEIAL